MILIDRTETDPYFNIAAEEYVLKEFTEDVFMLWVNSPAVIIGKHQVAAAEADMIYTYKKNIPLIREIMFSKNGSKVFTGISRHLKNVFHHPKTIKDVFLSINFAMETDHANPDELIAALF